MMKEAGAKQNPVN